MNSTELQLKFQELKETVQTLSLEKAKAEANLDTIAKQKDEALKTVKTLANVLTIEEAEVKLERLGLKLETLAKEAEDLLNG